MVKSELVVPKVWRSELKGVALFLFFCVLCKVLSDQFPGSVLTAPVFPIGGRMIELTLPLWWFLPFVTLIHTTTKIYNVRYTIDRRGVQSRVGILAMNQRITLVRYEDIRSIETEQTLLERMLDIGTVEISTAASGAVEVLLQGIAAPREVQDMLQRERDSRQRADKNAMRKALEDAAGTPGSYASGEAR